MKKILLTILALLCIFCFVACGGNTDTDTDTSANTDSSLTPDKTIVSYKVTVLDESGKEIYRYTSYQDLGKTMVASYECDLSKSIFPASLSAHADQGNTISVKVWVGSGDCLEVVNAKLVK